MRFGGFVLLGLAVLAGGCNAALGIDDVKLAKDTQNTSETKRDKQDGETTNDPREKNTPQRGTDETPEAKTDEKTATTPTGETTRTVCAGAPDCKRLAFVTRETFSGNLGGLAGADEKCFNAAKTIPGYGGHAFRAWLSNRTTSAKSRLPAGTTTYSRTDGALIANRFTDITDGSLNLPIALDQAQKKLEVSSFERSVWTGTNADGTANELNCFDWTNGTLDQNGAYGDSQATDAAWTESATSSCNAQRHLYCIEY